MKHTFEIDVPSILDMVSNPYKADLFNSCCDVVGKVNGAVLALPEKVNLKMYSGYIFSQYYLLRSFTNINVEVYDNSVCKPNCTAIPDVVATIDDKAMRTTEYEMVCHIHQIEPKGSSIFVVCDGRWQYAKGTMLRTSRDRKDVEHRTIVLANDHAFDSFIAENTPRLVQLKHGARAYTINGKAVAAFSTLYLYGLEEATRLLLTAYHEADLAANVVFPERLHTWDTHCQTYIEFRKSLNNEYHGFELPENEWKTNVPKHIRDKYHHGL